MRYRVSLDDLIIEADSEVEAQLQAVQTVLESPDLFDVTEDPDQPKP